MVGGVGRVGIVGIVGVQGLGGGGGKDVPKHICGTFQGLSQR